MVVGGYIVSGSLVCMAFFSIFNHCLRWVGNHGRETSGYGRLYQPLLLSVHVVVEVCAIVSGFERMYSPSETHPLSAILHLIRPPHCRCHSFETYGIIRTCCHAEEVSTAFFSVLTPLRALLAVVSPAFRFLLPYYVFEE